MIDGQSEVEKPRIYLYLYLLDMFPSLGTLVYLVLRFADCFEVM